MQTTHPRRLALALLCSAIPGLALAQQQPSASEIPVYPGARLVVEEEEGEEAVCCSFLTQDPVAKVLAFYEARLGTKPLTLQEYLAKYPAMRPEVERLQRELPPGVQYRAFPLRDVEWMGRRGAELFEVLGSGTGTRFSITAAQLGSSGARWGFDFRQKTNTLTEEDRFYTQWVEEHQAARTENYNLPVYPGALAEGEPNVPQGWPPSGTCYTARLITTDPLEKVMAFYARTQLKPHVSVAGGMAVYPFGDLQWDMWESDMGDEPARVYGRRGAVRRLVRVEVEEDVVPTYPYFNAAEERVVAGPRTKAVVIELSSQVLDEACVRIPRNATWHPGPPRERR